MATPEQSRSNKWSDEAVIQPAGDESRRSLEVDNTQSRELSDLSMPPVARYLDPTGEVPTSSFGDWQGAWIEDA